MYKILDSFDLHGVRDDTFKYAIKYALHIIVYHDHYRKVFTENCILFVNILKITDAVALSQNANKFTSFIVTSISRNSRKALCIDLVNT